MKINWKVRTQNKTVWIAAAGTIITAVQSVAAQFGYTFDGAGLTTAVSALITGAAGIGSFTGLLIDPTTAGLSDSNKAMTNVIKSKAQTQIDLLTTQNSALKEQNEKLSKPVQGVSEDNIGKTDAINPGVQ